MRMRDIVLLGAAAWALTHGSAGAAPAAREGEARKAAPAKAKGKAKVLKLEELKVEGKIQKPQAMFLMPRANLNVGELDHTESLLPRITAAAEKEPL
jgi:hypothetical protein